MGRDIDTVLTSEFTKQEWKRFRKDWIKGWEESLVTECGMDPKEAKLCADIDFESYCGQEGYTMRDEQICGLREIDERNSVPANPADREGW